MSTIEKVAWNYIIQANNESRRIKYAFREGKNKRRFLLPMISISFDQSTRKRASMNASHLIIKIESFFYKERDSKKKKILENKKKIDLYLSTSVSRAKSLTQRHQFQSQTGSSAGQIFSPLLSISNKRKCLASSVIKIARAKTPATHGAPISREFFEEGNFVGRSTSQGSFHTRVRRNIVKRRFRDSLQVQLFAPVLCQTDISGP